MTYGVQSTGWGVLTAKRREIEAFNTVSSHYKPTLFRSDQLLDEDEFSDNVNGQKPAMSGLEELACDDFDQLTNTHSGDNHT